MSRKDRVKGNAKPAKSEDAAALLERSTQAFVGFDVQDSFILIPEIQTHLKKLSKKDPCTKVKGLSDLSEILPNHGTETWLSVLPQWCRFYPKLCSDEDTSVRRQTQILHRLIVSNTKKDFVPYMKSVTAHWLISMFDPYFPAGREAKTAFFSIFPDQKWKNALLFCKEDLIALILENFSINPTSLDSDSEAALRKYNRLIGQSLALTLFLLQSLHDVRQAVKSQVLPTLLTSPNFVKLIELQDCLIQKNYLLLFEEISSNDMIDVFETEPVTGISLKPLENFSITETDELVSHQSWKLISKLESTKMYARAPKHEKQWKGKLFSALGSIPPLNTQLISDYLKHSVKLRDMQTSWVDELVKSFSTCLDNSDCRIAYLNEVLRSIFGWIGYNSDNDEVLFQFLRDNLEKIKADSSSALLQSEFVLLIVERSSKNEKLQNIVAKVLQSCCGDMYTNEGCVRLLLRFLKPEVKSKKVIIVQGEIEDRRKQIETSIFDAIYLKNCQHFESLPLTTELQVELAILFYERFSKGSSDLKMNKIRLQSLFAAACLDKKEQLLSQVADLAIRSNSTVDELKDLCAAEPQVLFSLIEADLKSESKMFFTSSVMFDLVSNNISEAVVKVIASNCLELSDATILKYSEILRTSEHKQSFCNIALRNLTKERSSIRKQLFTTCLENCYSIKDLSHAKDLFDSIEAYMCCDGLDFEEKLKWPFEQINETYNDLRFINEVLRMFNENAQGDDRAKFSDVCLNYFDSEIHALFSDCASSIYAALIFDNVLPPFESWSNTEVTDIDISAAQNFISTIQKVHIALSDVDFDPEKLFVWMKFADVLEAQVVPFRTFKKEGAILEIGQLFSYLQEEGCLKRFAKELTNAKHSSEFELTHLTKLVKNETETKLSVDLTTRSLMKVLHVNTLTIDSKFEDFLHVLSEVLKIISEDDDKLCDGANLQTFSNDVFLLNRQILFAIVSFFQSDHLNVETLRKLWDNVLCTMVCYGNSLQKTDCLSEQLGFLSFAQKFLESFCCAEKLVNKFNDDNLSQEWTDVFRHEIAQSACAVCIKLMKSDLHVQFNSMKFSEISCLTMVTAGTLKQCLSTFTSNGVSFLTPGLLSPNCVTQSMTCCMLEIMMHDAESVMSEWIEMIMNVSELSSVDSESIVSLSDLEGSQHFEVTDNETNQAVTSFLMATKLVMINISKLKSADLSEFLDCNEVVRDLKLEHFLSFLFKLINPDRSPTVNYIESNFYSNLKPKRTQDFLSDLAIDCYMTAIFNLPQICRSWFERLDRRKREVVDAFTSKFISPSVIKKAFNDVNSDKDMNRDERLTIKIFQGQNTIQAQYSIEDFAIDVKLSFAKNYPLGRINIEEIKKKKIGEYCELYWS